MMPKNPPLQVSFNQPILVGNENEYMKQAIEAATELGVDEGGQRHCELGKVRRELQHVIDVVQRSSVRPSGDGCGDRIADRPSEEGPVGGVRRRPAR